MSKEIALVDIKKEINERIGDKETFGVLVATTFNGLDEQNAKRAMMEGMMRGFTFRDFLQKNIYAVKFGSGYSLITSIDYARKLGMRNGIVGVDEPVYEMGENDNPLACSVTVHKRTEDGYVGDFTAKVYFKEYTTGKNQWATKPMTMIAKVAEMHALRKACPEELSQAYSEEEMQKEHQAPEVAVNSSEWKEKLESAQSEEELRKVWALVPPAAKVELKPLLETLKAKHNEQNNKVHGQGSVADGETGESVGDEAKGSSNDSTDTKASPSKPSGK